LHPTTVATGLDTGEVIRVLTGEAVLLGLEAITRNCLGWGEILRSDWDWVELC